MDLDGDFVMYPSSFESPHETLLLSDRYQADASCHETAHVDLQMISREVALSDHKQFRYGYVPLPSPTPTIVSWSHFERTILPTACVPHSYQTNTQQSSVVPNFAQVLYPRNNVQSRVRFNTMINVYDNISDLDEIHGRCWYSKADLTSFKGERKRIVRMLRNVNFDPSQIDTQKYDLRGLEAYQSPSFNSFMQKKRKEVLQAVIEEQRRQRCHGEYNVEHIRSASVKASSWAVGRALQMGNDDADEVRCPLSRIFHYESLFDFDDFSMDVSDVSPSIPSVCALSDNSMSTTSEEAGDLSWADKLMGEDIIPDTI